ncbi:MAG: sulfatase-like hydrolase/transferase [Opitutaceae bacterium]|nr:sulfatase-like hydrolase/transferase [Opitutaceae bacterium]
MHFLPSHLSDEPPMPLPPLLNRTLASRFGGSLVFIAVFVALATVMRVVLLLKTGGEAGWDASLLAAFALGFAFDLAAAGLWSLPLTLALVILPADILRRRWARGCVHAAGLGTLSLLLFTSVAEWTFWDEFGVRFNFIAVDYLIYTTEVIGNIRESYNLPAILGGVFLGGALGYGLILRAGWLRSWFDAAPLAFSARLKAGAPWFLIPLGLGLLLDANHIPAFANDHNRELAKNGPWSFFAAFRHNELDFAKFYPTLDGPASFQVIRQELARDGSLPAGPQPEGTLRYLRRDGPELRPNIIQITVESLSAEFLGQFNPASGLTPELDALAAKSLVFTQFYATGTRTDRGMEALTLSLPPTPGRSIIKRPKNADMFTLGSLLRTRGYDTAFIYSGYGYFDNMNAFFGNNGYRVIDRASVAPEDITFANAWGACDEDLFRWTLREADQAAAAGKPFHFFVMTTSNHRPFTYPEGKIDLPSKVSGRDGAVKYTDFAIGQLIRDAATRPWFKDTIFVIVADHCAESAGRTELPVQNYHIPLFIYAPGGQVAPGRVTQLTSQVDFAPTLLGLLNWSYATRFYGWDVLRTPGPGPGRALIGNYQRLGLYRDRALTVLKPVRQAAQYRYDPASYTLTPQAEDQEFRETAIAYYQTASYLYRTDGYGALSAARQAEIARAAAQP